MAGWFGWIKANPEVGFYLFYLSMLSLNGRYMISKYSNPR